MIGSTGTGDRRSSILITAFTVLAVAVSFCLAPGEPLRAARFTVERAGSAEGRVDHFIPTPAEEPVLLAKIDDPRFMFLRTGFQRLLIHGENHKAVSAFCRSPFVVSPRTNYIEVKTPIILKLRI
jgi:hypothetical protein